ncbi:DUF934 domain-containing protein [Roseateles koreensis]|uniref:DUF934 domain-containing protein n=1 Tax=Roseateles koreensis TaxID=2987526 RepID=A0ABT5KWI4_9BURK|nr:DUF934 domain-containing protein [Roseateles koreensis]MDC8786713.1 DUF934 domain-containing protein [Roseateles koreensis]
MKFVDAHRPEWHHVLGEDGPKPDPDPAPNLLLSLEQWHAVRDHWPAGLATGIELANDFDIEGLAADLPRFALIVLQFPKWVDGRAYSQARLLRSRYRFNGELRATGEVLVDMLPLLARTGFNAVQLRGDQSIEAAQRALRFFPAHYQGDVDAAQPIFTRKVPA